MTKKRVLHHPVLRERIGRYELWEGGGPKRTDFILKVPGGWMNLGSIRKCRAFIRAQALKAKEG